MGVPIEEISHNLDEYSLIESKMEKGTYDYLSRPIADCYDIVFKNLPSRQNNTQNIIGNIGREFGKLTLLIDAVVDCNKDIQDNHYNIWKASQDLPQDYLNIREYIINSFDKLINLASFQDTTISNYLISAKNNIRENK